MPTLLLCILAGFVLNSCFKGEAAITRKEQLYISCCIPAGCGYFQHETWAQPTDKSRENMIREILAFEFPAFSLRRSKVNREVRE